MDTSQGSHDETAVILTNGRDKVNTSRAIASGNESHANGAMVNGDHKRSRNRPRVFPYFKCLPYAVEDDARRQEDLEEILKHLYIALQAGDFAPGAVHWTRELRSWLSLKFDPTIEQRVKLVKLYYELALAPGIESSVAERFTNTTYALLWTSHFPGNHCYTSSRLWSSPVRVVLQQQLSGGA
jgi:proteasome activator subunit 4